MGAQRVHGGGRYFNPRSPHGERHVKPLTAEDVLSISTHAPRTGSDARLANLSDMLEISTHAPRTGSDSPAHFPSPTRCHFNPRSPHGERQKDRKKLPKYCEISTHAPRTGSD